MRLHLVGVGSVGSLISHHLRLALPPSDSINLVHKNAHAASVLLRARNSIRVDRNGVPSVSSGFTPDVASRHASLESAKLRKKVEKAQLHSLDSSSEAQMDEPREGEEDHLEKQHGAGGEIHSLIVCTKAQQTLNAVRGLLPRLASNCTITLLQNGMGVYEQLVSNFWPQAENRPHFILSSNTHGVYQRAKYDVIHAGMGSLEFGIVPDSRSRNFEAGLSTDDRLLRLDDITWPNDAESERYHSLRETVNALLLLSDSLNATWVPISHIQTTLRKKLVVNAVINPLTALMGCRNGDIFETPYARNIMSRVCAEAANVFAKEMERETALYLESLRRQGVDTDHVDVGRIPRELTKEALEAECLAVAEKTKGNISSMLMDIRMGRRTEIEFINGQLVRMGGSNGVGTPAIGMLRSLVKMREKVSVDSLLK